MAWSKEMTCRNFEVCHALSRCHAKRVGLESPFLERCFWYQLSNIGCQRDIVTALTIQDYSQSHVTMSRKKGRFGKSFPREIFQVPTFQYRVSA